ncbi:MAG: ankyrin repeat domain-containing protein, partial [Halioglobus sp.]
ELHWAAYRGHTDFVERLLRSGAAVNKRVEKGSTPLHLAAYKGHAQVVSLLIQYGAAVNATNEEGITPLDWARSNSHNETEAVLLANGAVVGKPLPVKSLSRRNGSSIPSPGQYLLSQSGQFRAQPLRKLPAKPLVEDDVIERPIRQEELDRLESVTQINEIMVKHRDKNLGDPLPANKVASSDDPKKEVVLATPEVMPEKEQPESKVAEVESTQSVGLAAPVLPAAGFRIQLAAVGEASRASVLKVEYAKRYSDVLGDDTLVIEPVKTAERELYRLRSRVLSQGRAGSICEQLKRRNQDCIVVAP